MPVLFDSATQFGTTVGGTGAGNCAINHQVNPLAANRIALVVVLWLGSADASLGTITVTFGGVAMQSAADPIYFSSGHSRFQLFKLPLPAGGLNSVSTSVSGMGSSGYFIFSSVTYSGVRDIGTIVSKTADSTTTLNTIVVPSVSEAYRVVTAHATGYGSYMGSYNLTLRSDGYVYIWPSKVAEIMMGDAPGAPTVTGTAGMTNNSIWGAFGIPLLPATLSGDASLDVAVDSAADGGIYRVGTPSPERLWVIEA